jgi:AcrR family transcriptional regulator
VSRSDGTARSPRDKERTRAAVLEAAAEAMVERGTAVSLDLIARRAGVSKSGLLHHFPNRDQLLVALVEDAQQRFRDNVLTHLDLSENAPGKLLRAYVRALTSGSEATTQYFSAAPAWAGIYRIPRVAEIAAADAQWWAENLAADGLSSERVMVVRRAAEGLAAAAAYGDSTPSALQEAAEVLLRLASGATFGN